MTKNKYHSIVVGGGIAGLTAAAYLSKKGFKTLLLEKNNQCGGLVNSFNRDGFHFDAGVRALEDAGIILPMLHDLGIDIETVKSPVSVGIEDKILYINDTSSLEEYRDLLIHFYPESKGDIDQFLKAVRRIMKHMDVLYGIENPVFKDIKHDREFLFKRLLPWLPKFLFTVGKINRMKMPVEDYLKDMIQDASLRDIISQHFFKNTPTFFALSYFSLYLDYFYPKGGVQKLADAVFQKIIDFGGEIKLQHTVTALDAANKTVTDVKGEHYYYENLIWAADLKTMYRVIKGDGLQNELVEEIHKTRKSMESSRGGDSVFSLFLEIDEPLDSFHKIAHGHFFYTPSKKGLGEIHRSQLSTLLNNWSSVSKAEILLWLNRYVHYNTFEISIPGLKDPTLAPEGKTGMIVSLLAEFDLFKKIKDDGWYEELKEILSKQIIQTLTDTIYPMLKENVIKYFSFSPVSIAERTLSSEGGIVGWTFEKPLPVVHKIQFSDKSVVTPIPNVYQAGQWAYSPAGVPMSILTGKLAADRIIKKR